MTAGAAPSRLKQWLALTLALGLPFSNPEACGLIALAAPVSTPRSGGGARGWGQLVASFLAGAPIPFLEPFGLSTPAQAESFARLMDRTALEASALAAPGLSVEAQAGLIREAADRYAEALISRTGALGALSGEAAREAVRGAQEEFADLGTLVLLVPERSEALTRGREAVRGFARAILTDSIQRARNAWEAPADGLAAAPAASPADRNSVSGLRKPRPAVESAARALGRGPETAPDAPALEAELKPETRRVLGILGLSYSEFQRLVQAQVDFERRALDDAPSLAQAVLSLRTQERFSRAVVETVERLRARGVDHAVDKALLLAAQTYYGDVEPDSPLWSRPRQPGRATRQDIERQREVVESTRLVAGRLKASLTELQDRLDHYAQAGRSLDDTLMMRLEEEVRKRRRQIEDSEADIATAAQRLAELERNRGPQDPAALLGPLFSFIGRPAWDAARSGQLEAEVLGLPAQADETDRRVARALDGLVPALFVQGPGSDERFMRSLRARARAIEADLAVLWSHPFLEDRQLIGHPVPKAGEDRLAFGAGELLRQIRRARAESEAAAREGRPARRVLLLIKNVEALDPGVRTALQEALRIRELTHPGLGTVPLPENLQILFTIRDGVNLEDDSFYDRVAVKRLPQEAPFEREALAWPEGATEENYLRAITVRRGEGAPVLVLPGAEIPLAEEFRDVTVENLHDEVYLRTGLVLDYQTVRMLSAMAQALKAGRPLLRIEGPTGVGKTFTAQGFARLRGKPFHSNPVNSDTELSEWIGGFEQEASGRFRFEGDTPFRRRLEEGGVVAVSELNTLFDHHERASLAWWLAKLAETEPDAQGYRTVPLSEVPVPEGERVPAIRVHPDALIVVDTNPESEYAARGAMPETFKERVPVLRVEPLIAAPKAGEKPSAAEQAREEARLLRYAEMFLKQDWTSGGRVLARGLPAERRARLARSLVALYRGFAHAAGAWAPRDGRVLSVRELKRMAQDLLWAEGRALQGEALAVAAATHLGGALRDARERREALALVSGFAKGQEPDVRMILEDQLFDKGRPVHLRVPAGADARRELERLAWTRRKVRTSLVSVTDELDRFQLEGGLVAREDGAGLEFGAGVFARMIEKAREEPDAEVLYVFDNAHNLRPEQLVAFNEFFQEGRLYPKGAPGELRLPPNARVLFVSRANSEIPWSPAERSRFVELYLPEEEGWAERVTEEALGDALPLLRDDLRPFLREWTAQLRRLWGRPGEAAAGVRSEARYRRFVAEAAAAVRATAGAGLGMPELAERLSGLAREVLLPGAENGALKGLERHLELFANTHRGLPVRAAEGAAGAGTRILAEARGNVFRLGSETFIVGPDRKGVRLDNGYPVDLSSLGSTAEVLAPSVSSPRDALDRARVKAGVTREGPARTTALETLGRLLREQSGELRWSKREARGLQALDVLPVAVPGAPRMTHGLQGVSADGRILLGRETADDGDPRDGPLLAFKDGAFSPLSGVEHDVEAVRRALSPDGRHLVAYHRRGSEWLLTTFRVEDRVLRRLHETTGLPDDITHLAVGNEPGVFFALSHRRRFRAYRRRKDGRAEALWDDLIPGLPAGLSVDADGREIAVQLDREARIFHWEPGKPSSLVSEGMYEARVAGSGIVLGARKLELMQTTLEASRWDPAHGGYVTVWKRTFPFPVNGRVSISADERDILVVQGQRVQAFHWDGTEPAVAGGVRDYQPSWTAALDFAPEAVSPLSGGRFVVVDEQGKLTPVQVQPHLVLDEATTMSVETGRLLPRSALPEDVVALAERAGGAAVTAAAEPFRPRYGDKPFYFASDEAGRVFLNYKGEWQATRHALLRTPPAGRAREAIPFKGKPLMLTPLALSWVRHPHAAEERGLKVEDFLMETETLAKVEAGLLAAFRAGWAVDLIGSPGAGKTSVAREAALLLGLPGTVFQMHGERELADLIGSYREDDRGRLRLTASPFRDASGRLRFKLPLLDAVANGGVFTLDEGAVGERGRELLSWFSALLAGDRELTLQEFPGREIRIPVHPDFRLIVANNDPNATAGRLQPKSEVLSNVHVLYVPDDDAPETLRRLFLHFLGGQRAPGDPAELGRWAAAASSVHHALKPLIGKSLGKDAKDRYALSKREIRRVAGRVLRRLRAARGAGAEFALYEALRSTYEAMFSHEEERAAVRAVIDKALAEEGLAHDADRLEREAAASFPRAATAQEARAAALTRSLLEEGEPVLHLAERGSRTAEVLRAAAESLGARVEPVDGAPEHGELELLGGLVPRFGARAPGAPRSRQARGRLTEHLRTREQLAAKARAGEKPQPVVLWLRNVDQWKEEVRTALNGLLEDGYIDVEGPDGRIERLFRPPHLYLAAEMPADSTQEFSSAFFNRWVKVGVSADAPGAEFRAALRARGAEPLEAHWVAGLHKALSDMDRERRWANRGAYAFGSTALFALAEALRQALTADPALEALLRAAAREGYDPRAAPVAAPDGAAQAHLEAYRELVARHFAREARRLLAVRLTADPRGRETSDAERFEAALAAVLGRAPPAAVPASALTDAEGMLSSVDGAAVRRRPGALALELASRRAGIRLTSQLAAPLGLLARADALGKTVALAGETGAGKTSVAALWAAVTGRRFYKYQSHAGSELADLTLDVEQTETGEFRKRVKEFYSTLREGNVVVDIDEANVAPWVLWALEPLLRGERRVHPVFPEEPSFMVGDGVQIVLTFNPARYSARNALDPRLLENMLTAWVGLPGAGEKARIVESFYGVVEESRPGSAATGLAPAPKPAPAPRAAPALTESGVAAPVARARMDREMLRGRETIDQSASRPRTPDGPRRAVRGVFEPDLFPHARHLAYDRYDGKAEEFVQDRSRERLAAPPAPDAAAAGRREFSGTHDLFEGRIAARLGAAWTALPSAGAEARLVSAEAVDASGRPAEVRLEWARDSADNLYIRAPGGFEGELRYTVAVPVGYFGRPVPAGVGFRYPDPMEAEIREAMGLAGLRGDETDFREVLHRLVEFFRDFSLEENGIRNTGHLFLDLVRSQCGVCRHRAFAFVRLAQGLGLEARYVVSDVHAYAEVRVPNAGWLRVDLGGGGDPMNLDLTALSSTRHQPLFSDDFPQPANYRRAAAEYAQRTQEALQAQGVEPQRASRAGAGEGEDESLAADAARAEGELKQLGQELTEDALRNDPLAPMFASGRGDTEFVYERMLRALRDRVRIFKKRIKRGLEIDPVAFMLNKPKQFVRRKKEERLQTTAVAVLLDFSGSMDKVRNQLAYTLAATGENFRRLREAAPQHFFYDLSWFTEAPVTVVAMGESLDRETSSRRLAGTLKDVAKGGTKIQQALKVKLKDFMESREARGAKVRYAVIFTDGADDGAVEGRAEGRALTPEMARLMEEYRKAGIAVIAVGIGQGAKDVVAFQGPGLHHVRVREDRSQDIAEAIAKVAELKSRGAGRLPDGSLNEALGIPEP